MTGRIQRVPAHGRRAIVLRAARDEGLTISQIVVRIRAAEGLKQLDPSIERLKVLGVVTYLRRGGYLAQTPRGFRTTGKGLDLLRASESHHA